MIIFCQKNTHHGKKKKKKKVFTMLFTLLAMLCRCCGKRDNEWSKGIDFTLVRTTTAIFPNHRNLKAWKIAFFFCSFEQWLQDLSSLRIIEEIKFIFIVVYCWVHFAGWFRKLYIWQLPFNLVIEPLKPIPPSHSLGICCVQQGNF